MSDRLGVTLAESRDPEVLIPGDPAGLRRVIENWRTHATSAGETAALLERISTEDVWEGESADAFTAKFAPYPRRWRAAETQTAAGANALEQYTDTLEWARARVWDAIDAWTAAQAAAAPEAAPQPTEPAPDDEAQALLDDIQARVAEDADICARTLTGLADRVASADTFWPALTAAGGLVGEMMLSGLRDGVNALGSVGNAAMSDPAALTEAGIGLGLLVVGIAGEVGGGALDATGIGAVGGIPLNIVSAGAIGAGAGLIGAGIGTLVTDATGSAGVVIWESSGIDRGDKRDEAGHYTGKNGGANGPASDKERQGLAEVGVDQGADVIDQKIRSTVPGGNPNGRYYDGLIRNADGTYTAIEVKSGGARLTSSQRIFDGIVSPGSPATATLNGATIKIIGVILKRVP
ncbi:hypothetical protein D9V34_08030 [Mycetocola lacteus]|uniref:Putative T7SS secretion signal domain-containing protein n=1 Tax=Mycetocola lacteus TaxID=76637 RepID=A0A3L7AUG1_9MICO|nr:hypothetical protein [Mycetocola lacteus]RLP83170.1 hypothetical protein D9V34_08030 [Mycetocola lacteus]